MSASVRRRVIETPAKIIIIAIDRENNHCLAINIINFSVGSLKCLLYFIDITVGDTVVFEIIIVTVLTKIVEYHKDPPYVLDLPIESINLGLRLLLAAAKALRLQILSQNLDKVLKLF